MEYQVSADKPWFKFWPEGVPEQLDYPEIPLFWLLSRAAELCFPFRNFHNSSISPFSFLNLRFYFFALALLILARISSTPRDNPLTSSLKAFRFVGEGLTPRLETKAG